MPFPCALCKKKPFKTAAALKEHMANTAKHASELQAVIKCTPCNKTFGAQEALNQHLRDSPEHWTAACVPCNQRFVSQNALDQHMRDSPAHRVAYHCIPCNETFVTEGALDEHVLSSPAHNPPVVEYSCQQCNRSFSSNIALGMHMGSSLHVPAPPPATAETAPASDQTSRQSSESRERPDTSVGVEIPGTSVTEETPDLPEYPERKELTELPGLDEPEPFVTPLDAFFQSFPRFPYDRTRSPESSYRQLTKFLHLKKKSAEEGAVYQSYQDALVDEVGIWFGNTSDIHAWHHLCKAVGVRDPPPEIKDCKKIIRNNIHVNIVDLVDWARSGSPADKPVKLFENVFALRMYTVRTKKIFPRDEVVSDTGDRNVVLKHLLRQIHPKVKRAL